MHMNCYLCVKETQIIPAFVYILYFNLISTNYREQRAFSQTEDIDRLNSVTGPMS